MRNPEAFPSVSVIIPTHNYGEFIGEAVASVQNQTIHDFEIIVIDDGSTDETKTIISSIDDSRIVFKSTPNLGVSSARNLGLDIAKGEYVAFLDADDRWLPYKLEHQLAIMECGEAGAVFTDFCRFKGTEIFPRSHFEYFPEMDSWNLKNVPGINGAIILDDSFEVFLPLGLLLPCLPTLLMRRSNIGSIRFPSNIRFAEDWHFLARIWETTRFGFLRDSYVEVRRHGANSCFSRDDEFNPLFRALDDVADLLTLEKNKEILRRRQGQTLLGLGYHELSAGNVVSSWKAYYRALQYPGTHLNSVVHLAGMPIYWLKTKLFR